LSKEQSTVVAGLGGFIKVNLKKEMACGKNIHAGYFIRYPMNTNRRI
jgi:hypothetical protein